MTLCRHQVGHYKGRLRQGTEKRCNGVTCTPRFKYSFKSRGSQDIFVSKYNSSRNLQWARVAGGPGDDKVSGAFLAVFTLAVALLSVAFCTTRRHRRSQ